MSCKTRSKSSLVARERCCVRCPPRNTPPAGAAETALHNPGPPHSRQTARSRCLQIPPARPTNMSRPSFHTSKKLSRTNLAPNARHPSSKRTPPGRPFHTWQGPKAARHRRGTWEPIPAGIPPSHDEQHGRPRAGWRASGRAQGKNKELGACRRGGHRSPCKVHAGGRRSVCFLSRLTGAVVSVPLCPVPRDRGRACACACTCIPVPVPVYQCLCLCTCLCLCLCACAHVPVPAGSAQVPLCISVYACPFIL
jgi:hypothetical protein